jgi:hypothetical protein
MKITVAAIVIFCVVVDSSMAALCQDNCNKCESNGIACAVCVEGYYTNNYRCSKCEEEGCLQCPGGTCTACASGYNFMADDNTCLNTGQGRLIFYIVIVFIIIIVVSIAFVLIWKWKAISKFFKAHNEQVIRMKRSEKDGANWITKVMATNKILPQSALLVNIDDSREEINQTPEEVKSTIGEEQRSKLNLLESLEHPIGANQPPVNTTKIGGTPYISTTLLKDSEQPRTGLKGKVADGWNLELQDNRPSSQKHIPSPRSKVRQSQFGLKDIQPDNLSQSSALNTERQKEVDNECVKDFVKNAFEEASEKDIRGQLSDRSKQ